MAFIDVLGRLLDRIMNKNNVHTFDRTTDSLEAISEAIAVLSGSGMRPEMELYEGWQDELGIDFTLWTLLHPATAWVRGAGAGVAAGSLVATAPLLINELSRLVGNQRWPILPDLSGVNTITRVTQLEFEMTLSDVTQLLIGTCFFGFTPNQADTRANNNIVGFGLVGAAPAQALQTITDLAGAETVNTGFGEALAALNKFKITIVQVLGVATVQFYLNEALIASHITNLPFLVSPAPATDIYWIVPTPSRLASVIGPAPVLRSNQ